MKRDFRHGFDVSTDYCGTKQGEIQAGASILFAWSTISQVAVRCATKVRRWALPWVR